MVNANWNIGTSSVSNASAGASGCEKSSSSVDVQKRKDELSIDPQTGEKNPKSISEADSILQAENEGLVVCARRPDLSKGEPNLDFVIDGPEPYKFSDVKTSVNRGNLESQAQSIGKKSFLQKGGKDDVLHIVDLKNVPQVDKAEFIKNVTDGALNAANGKGSAKGIVFINT